MTTTPTSAENGTHLQDEMDRETSQNQSLDTMVVTDVTTPENLLHNLLNNDTQVSDFDSIPSGQASSPITINPKSPINSNITPTPTPLIIGGDLSIGANEIISDSSQVKVNTPRDDDLESGTPATNGEETQFELDVDEPLSKRLAKRLNRKLEPVELMARRYALTNGFDVEATIAHWLDVGVNPSHFIEGTDNKKELKMCFGSSNSRYTENIDGLGVQRNEKYYVNLPDDEVMEIDNPIFKRHPFKVGAKILLPEPGEVGNKIQFGTVLDWAYDVMRNKFYYKLMFSDQKQHDVRSCTEYPECRIFKKFESPRKPDENVLHLKGYTLVSCRRFKRRNLFELDTGDGDFFMVAFHDPEYYGWYGCWRIDEHGQLVHKNRQLIVYVFYEQMRKNDSVQQGYAKIGMFPLKCANEYETITKAKVKDLINKVIESEANLKCREATIEESSKTIGDSTMPATETTADRDEMECGNESEQRNESGSGNMPNCDTGLEQSEQYNRRVKFLEAQVNQIECRLDVMNQRMKNNDGEDRTTFTKELESHSTRIGLMVNETLMAFQEEIEENYVHVGDLPEYYNKMEKTIMPRICSVVEEFFFDLTRQVGIAKRCHIENGEIIDGYEEVVNDYQDVDLDTIKILPANERNGFATKGRIMEPTNKKIVDQIQMRTEEKSTESQNGQSTRSPGHGPSTGSPEPGPSTRSPNPGTSSGTAGNVERMEMFREEPAVVIDRDAIKNCLINRIVKSKTIPFDKKALDDLDEQTLHAISILCSPERRPNPPEVQATGNGATSNDLVLSDEISPLDLDLSGASTLIPLHLSRNPTPEQSPARLMEIDSTPSPRNDPDYRQTTNHTEEIEERRVLRSANVDPEENSPPQGPNNRGGSAGNSFQASSRTNPQTQRRNTPQATPRRNPQTQVRSSPQTSSRTNPQTRNNPQIGNSNTHETEATNNRNGTPRPNPNLQQVSETDLLIMANSPVRQRIRAIQRRRNKAEQRRQYLNNELEAVVLSVDMEMTESKRLLLKERVKAVKAIDKCEYEMQAVRHQFHTAGPQETCARCAVTPANETNRNEETRQAQKRLNDWKKRKTSRTIRARNVNAVRRNIAKQPSSDEEVVVLSQTQRRKKKKEKGQVKRTERCNENRKRPRYQESDDSSKSPENRSDIRRYTVPYVMNDDTRGNVYFGGAPGNSNNMSTNTTGSSHATATATTTISSRRNALDEFFDNMERETTETTNHSDGRRNIRARTRHSIFLNLREQGLQRSRESSSEERTAVRSLADSLDRTYIEEEEMVNQLLYGHSSITSPNLNELPITQTPSRITLEYENERNETNASQTLANEREVLDDNVVEAVITPQMRKINRAIINFEFGKAKKDRRCVRRLPTGWLEHDVEVLSERSGLFNWLCLNRVIKGRMKSLEKVKAVYECIDVNAVDVHEVEGNLKFEFLIGIWQWMLLFFGISNRTNDEGRHHYITRVRDKVLHNLASERYRIRIKDEKGNVRVNLNTRFLDESDDESTAE